MDYKDTVLDIHIRQELATNWVCNPFNDTPIELIKNTILDTALIQAKISFKAGWEAREKAPLDKEDRCDMCYEQGIKEVVEELRLRGDMSMNFPFSNIRKEAWLAQLKEWEINP